MVKPKSDPRVPDPRVLRSGLASSLVKDKGEGTTETPPSEVGDPSPSFAVTNMKDINLALNQLSSDLSRLRDLFQEIKELRNELVEMRLEREEMRKTISDQATMIEHLSEEINARERHSRLFNLRFACTIPETADEDPEEIFETALLATNLFDSVPDISIAHRVGRRIGNKPRGIIVRLVKKREVSEALGHETSAPGEGICYLSRFDSQRYG